MRTSPILRRAIVAGLLMAAPLTACGGDSSVTSTKADAASESAATTEAGAPPETNTSGGFPDPTVPDLSLPDLSLPDLSIPDLSIPADVSLPDFSDPQAMIDQLIAAMESAGLTVDRDCVEELLNDPATRDKFTGEGDISPELIQQFTACVTFG
jgi:hypothetical protein